MRWCTGLLRAVATYSVWYKCLCGSCCPSAMSFAAGVCSLVRTTCILSVWTSVQVCITCSMSVVQHFVWLQHSLISLLRVCAASVGPASAGMLVRRQQQLQCSARQLLLGADGVTCGTKQPLLPQCARYLPSLDSVPHILRSLKKRVHVGVTTAPCNKSSLRTVQPWSGGLSVACEDISCLLHCALQSFL